VKRYFEEVDAFNATEHASDEEAAHMAATTDKT
jgi:hypothetical protein